MVYKTTFSAVLSGDLPARLRARGPTQRMAYLFAAAEDTDTFVAKVRALQPAAG